MSSNCLFVRVCWYFLFIARREADEVKVPPLSLLVESYQ